ncbi:stalk domain-containing protein [Paenibacillus sp. 32352]|uniref:stalk domain-containing protein n=1 Tax=Paenibacillus sp. 32352 TaxID=1969111 RepID=UPI0009ABAF4C|nr:stalk domain-containing protein [Paenibacillus sp. 32352]
MKKRRFVVQTSKVIMALAVILGGQTALAQAVHLAPVVQVASAATNTVTVDGFEYSKEVAEGLTYLNSIRKKAGLSDVKLNPFLAKASENHANYLIVNSMTTLETFSHREEATKKGYTGVKARDRVTAVGAGTTFQYHSFDEGIFLGVDSVKQAIDIALGMAYHRDPLTNPNLDQVGIAINGKTVVLVYTVKGQNTQTALYPYNGQTNVPLSFNGLTEAPNPLKQFGVNKSGFVISYKEYTSPQSVKATIKNSKGESVDFYLENAKDVGYMTWFLYPKKDLAPNETYTVTVNNTTWSFTTVSNGTTSPTTPTAPTGPIVNEKPPRKFSANDVGVRLNGKYIDVTPKAKVINGSTFIPLRGVLEKMGATLTWNGALQEVNISAPNLNMAFKIGRAQALVNQKVVQLSAAPFISAEGSTYVPLRFISETLGAKVSWEPEDYVAVIDIEE